MRSSLSRRRSAVALICGTGVLIGAALVAGAEGGLTITPSTGLPGSSYQVAVACESAPQLYRRNLQDDSVQGTIAPYPADQLSQVSPSVWAVNEVATRFDAQYNASCAGAEAGSGRFDAEAPHLWFGPRPSNISGIGDPKTTVEGTDCPVGTTAMVSITADGETSTAEASIDQYGDWSVPLPAPVGEIEVSVDAICGGVQYDSLRGTTTTTAPVTPTTPTTTPGTAPAPVPPPATAQPGSAVYTG